MSHTFHLFRLGMHVFLPSPELLTPSKENIGDEYFQRSSWSKISTFRKPEECSGRAEQSKKSIYVYIYR